MLRINDNWLTANCVPFAHYQVQKKLTQLFDAFDDKGNPQRWNKF